MLDRAVVQGVFDVLRAHGWEGGWSRLAADPDPAVTAVRAWLAAERGHEGLAEEAFAALEAAGRPGWVHAGRALLALRAGRYADVEPHLAGAGAAPETRAVATHLRGVWLLRQNRLAEALATLSAQAGTVTDDDFLAGRLLDTLGMVYASKDDFTSARALFERSLELKARFGDDAGLALTHGNLGRLYFEWGLVVQALAHFEHDLELAEAARDHVGVAAMWNWIGRCVHALGRPGEAVEHLGRAVAETVARGFSRMEGFARKDLAAAWLAAGEVDAAARELGAAEARLVGAPEGLAHCALVEGGLRAAQGDRSGAIATLERAARHFADTGQRSMEARAHLERARALGPGAAAVAALQRALHLAEECRRDALLREIEEELRRADPVAHLRLVYRRVRGRSVEDDTVSLLSGSREVTTILFLDLKGSSAYGLTTDPEVVLTEFNQLMSGFGRILSAHGAIVSGYRGDGFMALVRGPEAPLAAARAGLEMCAAMGDFNLPRRLLGRPEWQVRVGIATGPVCNGNVGTYDKMDFTAIGPAANLAARLEGAAAPGRPCVCAETAAALAGRLPVGPPRRVPARGFGDVEVHDLAP